MAEAISPQDQARQKQKRLTAGICIAFFGGMLGMAYAAVPLYAMFCQVTGYGVVSIALGVGFVYYAWKVLLMPDSDRAMKPAKALFGYSLLYLFGIFAAYLADAVVQRAFAAGM